MRFGSGRGVRDAAICFPWFVLHVSQASYEKLERPISQRPSIAFSLSRLARHLQALLSPKVSLLRITAFESRLIIRMLSAFGAVRTDSLRLLWIFYNAE